MAGDTVGGGVWPNSALSAAKLHHALTREFQRRTIDWRVLARGEVFFDKVSTGW